MSYDEAVKWAVSVIAGGDVGGIGRSTEGCTSSPSSARAAEIIYRQADITKHFFSYHYKSFHIIVSHSVISLENAFKVYILNTHANMLIKKLYLYIFEENRSNANQITSKNYSKYSFFLIKMHSMYLKLKSSVVLSKKYFNLNTDNVKNSKLLHYLKGSK